MRHPIARRVRRTALLGGVALCLLLLAACTTPEAAPPGTPTGTPTAEHGSHPARVASSAPAGFCADWFGLAAESGKFAAAQNASTGQPGALRASVQATTAYLKTLAESAPDDIRADFTTYAQWWTDFSGHMTRVDYDFAKVAGDPELQRAMQATSEPKFTQASARISAWVQKNCNVLR